MSLWRLVWSLMMQCLLTYLYEEKEAPLCLLTLNQHLKMLNHNY